MSERELACITEEEKNKITERALLLKSQKELTESEKVERENAAKRRLAEQRVFIIKSDYDETISKLKHYSKRFVIPSYKEWVKIIEDAKIEKPTGIIACVIATEFGNLENAIQNNRNKIAWNLERINDLKRFL